MNNRYLFCLLMCVALLYFAVPRLNFWSHGLEKAFAFSWLAFAILVFAGNLAALLFPRGFRKERKGEQLADDDKERKHMRAN